MIQRIGGWYANVNFPVTIVGSNAALSDPLGYAIRIAGGTVATAASKRFADLVYFCL